MLDHAQEAQLKLLQGGHETDILFGVGPNRRSFQTASCCNPKPNQAIAMAISPEGKFQLHSANCHLLNSESEQTLWLEAEWKRHRTQAQLHRINITGTALYGQNSQISNLLDNCFATTVHTFYYKVQSDQFKCFIDIFTPNPQTLNDLQQQLIQLPGVQSIEIRHHTTS